MYSVLVFVLFIWLFRAGEAEKSLRSGKGGLLKTILAADGENTSIFAHAIKQFEKLAEKDEKLTAKVEALTAKDVELEEKLNELIPEKKVRLVKVERTEETLANAGKAGRLEVWFKGEWGTVCGDAFQDKDAAVVCRTLGLSGGAKMFSGGYQWHHKDGNDEVKENELGAVGNGPIWIDDAACTGSEQDFLDCPRAVLSSYNCDHYEDVFMKCN